MRSSASVCTSSTQYPCPPLRAGELQAPLTIVLVNNGGGGIFSFLPVADAVPEDAFTPLWATPQNVDLAGTPQCLLTQSILLDAHVCGPCRRETTWLARPGCAVVPEHAAHICSRQCCHVISQPQCAALWQRVPATGHPGLGKALLPDTATCAQSGDCRAGITV